MENSKHYSFFDGLSEALSKSFRLVGDTLLVQELPKEDLKTKSGLILTEVVGQRDSVWEDRPLLVQVLVVGEGFYDEEKGESVPLDSTRGSVLLVPRNSVRFLSNVGPFISEGENRFGLVREREVQAMYSGVEAYNEMTEYLRAGMEANSDVFNH